MNSAKLCLKIVILLNFYRALAVYPAWFTGDLPLKQPVGDGFGSNLAVDPGTSKQNSRTPSAPSNLEHQQNHALRCKKKDLERKKNINALGCFMKSHEIS